MFNENSDVFKGIQCVDLRRFSFDAFPNKEIFVDCFLDLKKTMFPFTQEATNHYNKGIKIIKYNKDFLKELNSKEFKLRCHKKIVQFTNPVVTCIIPPSKENIRTKHTTNVAYLSQ